MKLKTICMRAGDTTFKLFLTRNPFASTENGYKATENIEQLEIWRHQFTDFISTEVTPSTLLGLPQRTRRINTQTPTLLELKTAIPNFKSNKAAGTDTISAELF